MNDWYIIQKRVLAAAGMLVGTIFGLALIAAVLTIPALLIWNYGIVAASPVLNPIKLHNAFLLSLAVIMFKTKFNGAPVPNNRVDVDPER